MIPKIIHFCWLSNEEYPPLIKYCIKTWKQILPDYEVILWDASRFDINSVPWVREAFEAKKYAFAADYIRLYALYTMGGIYLDSDVEMLRTFNPLLINKSFLGVEASTGMIEAAIMAAEANQAWCEEAMSFYRGKSFSMDYVRENDMLAPKVVGRALQNIFPELNISKIGKPLRVNNGDLMVYPAEYFSPIKYDIEKSYSNMKDNSIKYKSNPHTFCIHRFNASWTVRPSLSIQYWEYIKKKLNGLFGEEFVERMLNIIRKFIK